MSVPTLLIELLVLCSVQLILNILLYMSISNTFSLLRSAALTVQLADKNMRIYTVSQKK